MIRMGVSGCEFSSGTGLPGESGSTAVKRLCVGMLKPFIFSEPVAGLPKLVFYRLPKGLL